MVWSFALRYPGHIAVAGLALLFAAGAASGVPYAFKLIIAKGFGPGAGTTRDIARWFEYLLLLVGVMAVATAVRYYFVSWIGERTVADIRLAVHRNLLRLSPGFFEENRPAEITSRITVDTTIIEQVVGTTVSVMLRNLVLAIVCVVILFALAPKLAALVVAGAVLVVGPIAVVARQVRAISRRSQDRIADVGTVTSEVLGAMKIVQAFGQQEREASRFTESVERVFGTAKRRILLRWGMRRPSHLQPLQRCRNGDVAGRRGRRIPVTIAGADFGGVGLLSALDHAVRLRAGAARGALLTIDPGGGALLRLDRSGRGEQHGESEQKPVHVVSLPCSNRARRVPARAAGAACAKSW